MIQAGDERLRSAGGARWGRAHARGESARGEAERQW